jgi:hypothetical protein
MIGCLRRLRRSATRPILLVRRIDDGNWELPGGRIEVGEIAPQAVIREIAECSRGHRGRRHNPRPMLTWSTEPSSPH